MKRVYIITLLMVLSLDLLSQDKTEIIPPSPSLQNLQRFDEIPVEPYTGLANTTIPIYQVESGDLKVPISISCHASGRKRNDIGGPLGIGWSLFAGGFVSRTINGLPDEVSYDWLPYISESCKDELGSNSQYCYNGRPSYEWFRKFNRLASGEYYDWTMLNRYHPDLFSYSLPNGKSGKFIIKPNPTGVPQAMTIPYEPIKIVFPALFGSDTNYEMDRLKIIDTDGTQYWFGIGSDNSKVIDYKSSTDADFSSCNWSCEKEKSNTGWYLCTMISASGSDTVYFEYVRNREHLLLQSESFSVTDILDCSSNSLANYIGSIEHDQFGHGNNYHYQPGVVTENMHYLNNILSSINYKNGTVSFECDSTPATWGHSFREKYYSKININDKNNNVHKSFHFYLSDEMALLKTKLLDSLIVFDNTNSKVQRYSFEYYTTLLLSLNSDWWGYFNNEVTNNLIPQYDVVIAGISNPNFTFSRSVGNTGVSRTTNLVPMRQGMLKKINYPTGGFTEFQYETNTFDYNGTTQQCGGLRVSTVTNVDGFGNVKTRNFTYGNGVIRETLHPTVANMITEAAGYAAFFFGDCIDQFLSRPHLNFRTLYFNSELNHHNPFQTNIVYYETVSEHNGSVGQNNGLTTYFYNLPYRIGVFGDSIYQFEKEYRIYNRDGYNISSPRTSYSSGNKYQDWKHAWKKPVLLMKNVYKNSSSQAIESHTYEYSYIKKDSVRFNTARRFVNFQLEDFGCSNYSGWIDDFEQIWTENSDYADVWGIGYHTIESAQMKLKKETVSYQYDNISTPLTEEKHFNYDSLHLKLSCHSLINSDGDSIRTTYTYPHQHPSVTPCSLMVALNILDPVITKTSASGFSWDETKTDYQQYGTGLIRPQMVATRSSLNQNYEAQITYNEYDTSNGNIWRFTTKDGLTTCIFWAYNKTYPVAKIVSGGALNIASTLRNTINNRSYCGTDIKTQVDSDINFLTQQLSTYIGDSNYHVTLYTYKPLVGLTSETNSNGLTTYYTYDSFGRLFEIKDDDGRTIKKHTYNYANQ